MKVTNKSLVVQVVVAVIAIVSMVFSLVGLVGAIASHNTAAIFGWSSAIMWCCVALMWYNTTIQYEKLIDEYINNLYNKLFKK